MILIPKHQELYGNAIEMNPFSTMITILFIFLMIVINSISFKFKQQVTGNNGTKYVETMLPLKYLSIFWRTLEIPLINCEVILMFTRSNKLPFSRWYCSKSSTKVYNR